MSKRVNKRNATKEAVTHSLLDESIVAEHDGFHSIQKHVTVVRGVVHVFEKAEKNDLLRNRTLRVRGEQRLTLVQCDLRELVALGDVSLVLP